ncbi:MAG: C-type lectin domain-containing protein [Pirellulales bacterium]
MKSNIRQLPSILVAVAFVSILASSVHATTHPITFDTVPGGTIVNPANGHTYELFTGGLRTIAEDNNWIFMEAEAVARGGHLVTVNDAAEEAWIEDNFLALILASSLFSEAVWIGLNDIDVEGTFVWSSGQTPTYTNWADGEPNNVIEPISGIGEDVVKKEFNSGNEGRWNDVRINVADPGKSSGDDTSAFSLGLVEIEPVPEPASAALACLAALAIASLRRRIA